jgi:hypothetical protein
MLREMWKNQISVSESGFEMVEVIQGMKQVAVVVRLEGNKQETFGLYRPERGLMLTLDQRIPKPMELYRDCAYSEMCRKLGWDQVAPVYPWQVDENDKGVIRPYWREIKAMQIYDFDRKRLLNENSSIWLSIAIADYVFGVTDRAANDFLVTDDGLWVVDSGLSFVSDLYFAYQNSILRESLRGVEIYDLILLGKIKKIPEMIDGIDFLTDENKYWVIARSKELLRVGKIL